VSYALGFHAVRLALTSHPERVRTVYYARGRRDARVQEVIALAREAAVRFEAVDRSWLDARVEGNHQGVAALCHALSVADEAAFEAAFAGFTSPRLLLVLDGVSDPRNLGACLRSANAAGVQAVLWPERNSAPVNDLALKTAAGGAEDLLLVRVKNLARRLNWLKDQGVWLVGADERGETAWCDADLTGDVALVMGGEGTGLRRLSREACDTVCNIPMQGSVSSLNVSVATGVFLFEAVRQRK
jgi:23S rRNA (guanosine2251-2'-O)-methyltransferase